MSSKLDAIVITGAQPRTSKLTDEPYWHELIEIIEWSTENTSSTILSCLAAHAGVLYLDGVERQRLSEKRLGLFAFTNQYDHPLVGRRGGARLTPHSRYNELLQTDLELAGYDILASSPVHGVDIFTKSFGSQFVFLQGHPEYDADMLAREFRRDLGRCLRGEIDTGVAIPNGYFTADAEAELLTLQRSAFEAPHHLTVEKLARVDALAPTKAEWRGAAVSFYRNWLKMVAASPGRPAARLSEPREFAAGDI